MRTTPFGQLGENVLIVVINGHRQRIGLREQRIK
tara:strand:+ start:335 stop:436 length:102 start_codon:yes stop_codon:yes gene_type:complete